MSRYVQAVAVLALCLVAMTASCRRNQPSLIDRNQPPDTQLWYAPPDSTEYQYLVHMYWRGTDNDGTTQRFIWAIQDTIAAGEQRWNPSARLSDYRQGRITTRTDSVFSFTAFKDVAGVGVRKNRQAFFVASIDDNGVIDPEPAGVEFVATIGRLPEIRFTTYVNGVARPYQNLAPPADTVGMFSPFQISYHGYTTNGTIRGYQFFPLNSSIVIPGAGIWTNDLGDTLRSFPNTGADALPAGTFRFAAKTIDDANAESQVDAGQFRRGVALVQVNFDPDTRIEDVKNTWVDQNDVVHVDDINFTDATPDTVPYGSWLYYQYFAFDDRRDTKVCSPTDADKCIDFQVKYIRNSARVAGAREDSGWLPRNGRHDSDANSATDSNSVNVGSLEYQFYAGGIDENGARDGTPPLFSIVGNFDPKINTTGLRDHFNDPVNVATIDTLTWNFYKGVGWPYSTQADTVGTSDGRYYKRFAWTLSGTGQDDARDPAGGVENWRYYVYTDYNAGSNTGTFWPLGRAGDAWFPGPALNVLNDRFELTVKYDDPEGDDLLANLPAYFNNTITIVLYGRDTGLVEPDFKQWFFLNVVPPGSPAGSGVGTQTLINSFSSSTLGRWTPKKVITFYLKFER